MAERQTGLIGFIKSLVGFGVNWLEYSRGYNKSFRDIYDPLQNNLSFVFYFTSRLLFRISPDQHQVNY